MKQIPRNCRLYAALKELLDSLQEQTYPCWELILADAGTGDSVRKAAEARG